MRLATRLSLSYIGFVVLLGLLVTLLAGFQVTRLARYVSTLPFPGSPATAAAIVAHLEKQGLTAPIPPEMLRDTLDAGGWAQVLDASGREIAAVSAPADRRTAYTPAELAALTQDSRTASYQMRPVNGSDGTALGILVLSVPKQERGVFSLNLPPLALQAFGRYFLSGFLMAVLAAVLLSLAAGFWYARRLARPLARLSGELTAAAAGDFSHRIPEAGKDEFAALAGAYNHLVEQLQTAERERTRLEEARRDLVANISHDLRTPLTSIQGFTERLADESTPEPERRRYAEVVATRIQELDGLLGDLLELSRLQALPVVRRQPLDLAELFREQVIARMPEIEQANLTLDVDLPDDLPPVAADGHLIARALQNLLTNALRHGDGASRLTVSAARSGDGVALRVADDGPGIPAADVPMLFERYYRGTSATARHSSGSGLGLAIVRQIAESHGGRISVKTADGQGTAFILWLPLSG